MTDLSTNLSREEGPALADYDYDLPPGRIARYPAAERDDSRLLVVSRTGGGIRHDRFRDLPRWVAPGDLLVLNESRVLPARLLGVKPTGAPSEILLLRPAAEEKDPRLWEALVRPGGKLKPGREVVVSPELTVQIVDSAPGGGRIVRLVTALEPREAMERFGHVPLPPYLDREDEPLDRERYQTVYARVPGSVAAPTAGLHFTTELLKSLEAKGVRVSRLHLHVGVGTFRPVETERPEEHTMHVEAFAIPEETAAAVRGVREAGGRVWAVGSTVVRALESAATQGKEVRAGRGETDLFIRPGFGFRVVDALITNFHLPRSTLLMLVAAFTGYQRTMEAYREAIAAGYRFYSYGDAMAVL